MQLVIIEPSVLVSLLWNGGTNFDWISLVVGVVVGAIAGLLLQNILYPYLERRLITVRERSSYVEKNKSWAKFTEIFPDLKLLQAGWPLTYGFAPHNIRIRLEGRFQLLERTKEAIRDRRAAEWAALKSTDDEQVGMRSVSIYRTSDSDSAEREGRSHVIEISAHI